MTEPTTHTLDVPGAVLHYDVRRNDSSVDPPLLLIGSPMGAAGFATPISRTVRSICFDSECISIGALPKHQHKTLCKSLVDVRRG